MIIKIIIMIIICIVYLCREHFLKSPDSIFAVREAAPKRKMVKTKKIVSTGKNQKPPLKEKRQKPKIV